MPTAIDRILKPKTFGDILGINGPWPWEGDRIVPFVNQCKALSVGMARVSGDWTAIQRDQKPNVFNTNQFKPMYNALTDAGIVVQLVCGYVPNYLAAKSGARHPSIDKTKLDLAMQQYEKSMYALGIAFPKVSIIELWSNESNAPYGITPVDPTINYCLCSAGAKGWRRAKKEQGVPSIVLAPSMASVAQGPDISKGMWPWNFMDAMLDVHKFFAAVSGQNWKNIPLPWDVWNIHAYMTWGVSKNTTTGKYDRNWVPGNLLTHGTEALIWQAAVSQNEGFKGIKKPFVWNSESGWPTIWGHAPSQDMPFIARLGGWNSQGTPTTAQLEAGAAKLAVEHLDYWMIQCKNNLAGPFNIFLSDDRNGEWSYGLYTDLFRAQKKATAEVVKRYAAKPFSPPAGWMAGIV